MCVDGRFTQTHLHLSVCRLKQAQRVVLYLYYSAYNNQVVPWSPNLLWSAITLMVIWYCKISIQSKVPYLVDNLSWLCCYRKRGHNNVPQTYSEYCYAYIWTSNVYSLRYSCVANCLIISFNYYCHHSVTYKLKCFIHIAITP